MTPYDMIKAQLSEIVPFQNTVGVTLLDLGDGVASAELSQREAVSNHIGSMHAGAMFTLGEAASGAAMAGALAPIILQMRPVAATSQIAFKKVAKGTLIAHAKTSRSGAELMQAIKEDGKVAFDVAIDIRDAQDDTVVEMSINWYVSATRP
jgi:acyl-coenzyme A thioesterase PaaI-like protein